MGGVWSIITENVFPGTPKYSANDIPDMSGKVVLVTGATAGIGKETARVSQMAYHTFMSTHSSWSRVLAVVVTAETDQVQSEATLRDLKSNTGRDAHLLLMDLANLKSIKAAAEEFLSTETQLHVLFNNAGVMTPPMDQLTDDGYDFNSGQMSSVAPDGIARVVNTSSNGHWFGNLKFDTWKDGPARRKQSNFSLYGQSKAGNIVFSAELKRRYGDQGIVSTSLNPGGVSTELTRHASSFAAAILNSTLADVSYGAITQLYAGTVPDGASLNGKYLIPWARIGKPRADTQDPQLGKELWTWLEEQVANA
ncbi:hypothetical protein BU15DRAFT_78637 [Melanogaster broomeanus]|nr:hypothetical protein BU15DRAFT_78637 [Melanogaster broomeanus]